MNKAHMSLVIVFSVVVLKYNMSAFVQPFWCESLPEAESTVWVNHKKTGVDNKEMIEEFLDLLSQWSINSGLEGRDRTITGRIRIAGVGDAETTK